MNTESIEDAVKSGDEFRIRAAIAEFERKGRRNDYIELAVLWLVVCAILGAIHGWASR